MRIWQTARERTTRVRRLGTPRVWCHSHAQRISSVAVDEITLDNDQLAAMVSPLVEADLVVLLSDVEGLLNSHGRRIAVVRDVANDALPHVRRSTSTMGWGGMGSESGGRSAGDARRCQRSRGRRGIYRERLTSIGKICSRGE